ncbi:hypothetical protein E1301_Tti004310 [Triplophysa tibetana]|uniref:Receptor activity-modifying protein 2 n=1 Tax=Triplophysa tibetana TaxID=1572043 RepID=A0A5A9N8H8_9TELE|nr:hypothetical protein E1301_Tti004310 [Triplophysa tibetana]
MAHVSTTAPVGTLLFWVCLNLMVTGLQTLLPNGQKHTERQTTSTPLTEEQTLAYNWTVISFTFINLSECANKNVCDIYCSVCVESFLRPQQCYESLVIHFCEINFHIAMDNMNSTDWCSLEKVKSAYNNFTLCTESIADCFLLPWPNHFVEDTFVDIHATYFQECPTEGLRDPPPRIVLALVMTPICLIPVMVVLVVLKTKNGDMRN